MLCACVIGVSVSACVRVCVCVAQVSESGGWAKGEMQAFMVAFLKQHLLVGQCRNVYVCVCV